MDDTPDSLGERDRVGPFPDGLEPDSTVLLAGTVEPETHAVGLRALCRYGHAADTALVVTATESADRTATTYDRLSDPSADPSIGLVDTTSEGQSVAALYEERPVVFVPAPGDLERLVIALSDLTGVRSAPAGSRHLLVRSLTPLLEGASVEAVAAVLERVAGLRTGTGLTLLGLDYTTHGRETMAALTDRVDGVVWATETADGTLEFEFSPTGDGHAPSAAGVERTE